MLVIVLLAAGVAWRIVYKHNQLTELQWELDPYQRRYEEWKNGPSNPLHEEPQLDGQTIFEIYELPKMLEIQKKMYWIKHTP